jgi:DNA-3-methyladenine glycosylase I
MEAYHDLEWGTPMHDDRALFELITLEGAQAGLSWSTILHRRDAYRRAFQDFDPAKVAALTNNDVDRLMQDASIIRNRQKIASTVTNARCVLQIQREHGSFDRYIWSFVDGAPIVNAFTAVEQIPAQTSESVRLSKALRKAGFGFVGPTICYAFMQSAGLVNDHVLNCDVRARILAST